MGGPSLIQFVAWGSTLACVLGALWLLRLAVFRDKDRGKARCPKCWYELGRLDSPPALPVTCPECGKKVETLRQLKRRRFKRWPVLAIIPLVIAAWIGWNLPQIDQRGWLWLVPDRVLFEVYPLTSLWGDVRQQLYQRLGVSSWMDGSTLRTLDDDDINALASRCARGNWFAPRLSPDWKQSYGPLLRGSLLPLPENPDAGIALGSVPIARLTAIKEIAAIPCRFEIHTRDRWPTALIPQQIVGLQRVDDWWPQYWTIDGVVEWSATNNRGETARGTSPYAHMQTKVDIPLQGEVTVDAAIKLFKLPPTGGSEERRLLITHPFQWKYRTVATIDDAFTPVVDPRIDGALGSVRLYTRGSVVKIDPTALDSADVSDVTFSVRITLRAGERVIGEGYVVWIGASKRLLLYRNGGVDESAPEANSLIGGTIPPGLTLTLTSDPSLAIQTQNTTRLWTGEVTFPLAPGAMIDPFAPATPPASPAPPASK